MVHLSSPTASPISFKEQFETYQREIATLTNQAEQIMQNFYKECDAISVSEVQKNIRKWQTHR